MLVVLFLASLMFCLDAHAQETRTIIAIVDTGIKDIPEAKPYMCEFGHKSFSNNGIKDTNDHGTNIFGILVKGLDPKEFCVVVIKYYDSRSWFNASRLVEALEYLQKVIHPKYLNLSLGGGAALERERLALEELLKQGTRIAVAAGNDGKYLTRANVGWFSDCGYYPACYDFKENFYSVGNLGGFNGKFAPVPSSNYGPVVKEWRVGMQVEGFGIKMSGTSQATAVFLNELIKKENDLE